MNTTPTIVAQAARAASSASAPSAPRSLPNSTPTSTGEVFAPPAGRLSVNTAHERPQWAREQPPLGNSRILAKAYALSLHCHLQVDYLLIHPLWFLKQQPASSTCFSRRRGDGSSPRIPYSPSSFSPYHHGTYHHLYRFISSSIHHKGR